MLRATRRKGGFRAGGGGGVTQNTVRAGCPRHCWCCFVCWRQLPPGGLPIRGFLAGISEKNKSKKGTGSLETTLGSALFGGLNYSHTRRSVCQKLFGVGKARDIQWEATPWGSSVGFSSRQDTSARQGHNISLRTSSAPRANQHYPLPSHPELSRHQLRRRPGPTGRSTLQSRPTGRDPPAKSSPLAPIPAKAQMSPEREGAPRHQMAPGHQMVQQGISAGASSTKRGRFRTARAQRGHSANYYGDYPGNNPENHPPAESCTINSKLKNSNI